MSDTVIFVIVAASAGVILAAGYWLYGRRLHRVTRPHLEQAARLLGGDFDLGKRDGRLVDLTLGHGSFDGAHVVEGAPEDLVRALLTAEVCQLIAAHQIRIDLPDHGADDELRFTIRTWPSPPALSECVTLAGQLSKRAGELLTAAELAIAEGAVALGQVPADAVLAARAERKREIAEVEAMAASRARRQAFILVAVLAAAVGVGLLFVKFS